MDAAGLRRKTYLLTADLIERVESLAEAERVGINELARFLLGYAVEEVANGRLKVPTKPARRKIAS